MGILVSKDTRLVVQGITGGAGMFHTPLMVEYGTNVVAGVTPGKKGQDFQGIPIFDTVADAVKATGANTSVIFVPAPFAADAVLEAADAGVALVVCITEGIPTKDMAMVKAALAGSTTVMLGPNCPGVLDPNVRVKIGIMPDMIFAPGRIGVISRSGTLTYEAVDQVTRIGLGQSTCLGIGGDPIIGTNFTEALAYFEADDDTDAVIMIGEIGGNAEEKAAAYVRDHMTKPVVAFIAGKTAPPGKRMGHAGAIIAGGKGTAAEKEKALTDAGITVAPNPTRIGEALSRALNG
ncbi:MAG: succinate--CoA ligase subunit alpha [Pseudomonadota bacterium]